MLQEDLGVKYNPARVRDPKFQAPHCIDPDFRDSRDLFIHGIIDGPGGTCCSMPVLYVAVRRRLGYPLKLVETRGHLFFRWEDTDGKRFGFPERFNIEGAGEGIATFSDDHYRTWPEPWSTADEAGGWYLKSLSPNEELASFLATHGECLIDNGRLAEAIESYRCACSLAPTDARYAARLRSFSRRLQEAHLLAIEAAADAAQRKRKQRENMLATIMGTPTPPHGDYCQCAACRNIREQSQRAGMPGHLPGCQCLHCRQAAPTAITLPGHPPQCPCFTCRQANQRATRRRYP